MKRIILALIIIVTTALPAVAQVDQPYTDQPRNALPPIPEGFVWRTLDRYHAGLPVPREWHWKVEELPQAMNYYATRENIDSGVGFITGMTIWVITVEKGVDAVGFGREWVGALEEHGTVLDTSSGVNEPYRSFACRIANENAFKGGSLVIQHTAFVNAKTGTIYMVVFEAPKTEWDAAWEIGRKMLAGLVLDDER